MHMATGSIRGVDVYLYGRLPLATARLLFLFLVAMSAFYYQATD